MTDSTEPTGPTVESTEGAEAPRRPPGASVFTIEGRAAPGLYVVGWLATIMGLGILLVGFLASGGPAPVVLSAAGAAILSFGLISAAGSQAIERRARRAAAYVGPSPFLVFAASLPLTIFLVILVIGPAVAIGLDARSPVASLISVLLTAAVYIGLVRLLVVGTGALDWRAMGLGPLRPVVFGELVWGALLALPVVVVTSLLAAILVTLVGVTPDSPLPEPGNTAGLFINLIAASIIAPISEELFYRGFATTAWTRTMGPGRALVRGAVFFALIHVLTIGGTTFGDAAGRALVAFVTRLPVSVALGWVFLRRRSLYASIGLHATFNGLLVILAELASRSIAA